MKRFLKIFDRVFFYLILCFLCLCLYLFSYGYVLPVAEYCNLGRIAYLFYYPAEIIRWNNCYADLFTDIMYEYTSTYLEPFQEEHSPYQESGFASADPYPEYGRFYNRTPSWVAEKTNAELIQCGRGKRLIIRYYDYGSKRIMDETPFLRGEPHGKYIRYKEDGGKLIEEYFYGMPVSSKAWYSDGKIQFESDWSFGDTQSWSKYFSKDGKLIRFLKYDGIKKELCEEVYHPKTGKLLAKGIRKDGELWDGTFRYGEKILSYKKGKEISQKPLGWQDEEKKIWVEALTTF